MTMVCYGRKAEGVRWWSEKKKRNKRRMAKSLNYQVPVMQFSLYNICSTLLPHYYIDLV